MATDNKIQEMNHIVKSARKSKMTHLIADQITSIKNVETQDEQIERLTRENKMLKGLVDIVQQHEKRVAEIKAKYSN